MKPKVRRSSWLRRKFERWLMLKFMVRYGPTMIARNAGRWIFVDYWGTHWDVDATDDPNNPIRIVKRAE